MTFKNTLAGVVAGMLFGLKTAVIGLGIALVGLPLFPFLLFKILLQLLQKSPTRDNPKPSGVTPRKMAIIVPLSLFLGALAAPTSLLLSLCYDLPRQVLVGFNMAASEGLNEALWFWVNNVSSFSLLLGFWLDNDDAERPRQYQEPTQFAEDTIFPTPLPAGAASAPAPVHGAELFSAPRPNSAQYQSQPAGEHLELPQSPSPT